jgi:hypothetical protein
MKTRPYLVVLCLLISEITSFAQVSVPPISGWDIDEKGGNYILKPGKVSGETKEFIYEIMPVIRVEGQAIDDWFSSAIDKDIQQSGFVLPATSGKKYYHQSNYSLFFFRVN